MQSFGVPVQAHTVRLPMLSVPGSCFISLFFTGVWLLMLMLAPLRPLSGATTNTSPYCLIISANWFKPSAAKPSSLLMNISLSMCDVCLFVYESLTNVRIYYVNNAMNDKNHH